MRFRNKSAKTHVFGLGAAHRFFGEHFSSYNNWHTKKNSNKIHYATATFVSMVAVALVANTVYTSVFNSEAALSTSEYSSRQDWESGTLTNLDTKDAFGDIKLDSAGSWGSRALMTPPNRLTLGVNFTATATDIYVLRGNTDNAFYKYTPATDTWLELTPAPEGVYGGGSISYDGNNTIYAFFGNGKKTFYSYSISTNAWQQLDDLPDTVNTGSSMVWANGYLWAVKSQNTQDFWKYNPNGVAGEKWSVITYGLPATINNATSLVYDSTQYLYVLRGNNTTTWYRFDVSNPLELSPWQTMTTNYAANINEWTIGAFYDGAFYITHPNTTTLRRCVISGLTCSGGAWQTLETLPVASRYAGLQTFGSNIYVFRGNDSFDVWKFDPSIGATGGFAGIAMFPQAFTTGGDLIYDSASGYTYGFKGAGAANGFYRYDTVSNAWTLLNVTGLPTQSYDIKTVLVNGKIYLQQGNTRNFYVYNTANDALGWQALDPIPVAFGNTGHGAALSYNANINNDMIIVTRGAGQNTIAAYSIINNNWTTHTISNLPAGANVNIGGRLVSSGSNFYALLGAGNSRFYRYDLAGNTWTEVTRAPFSPYYGTDLTSYNGKIYALAGNYRKYFYEYDTSTGLWRRLKDFSGQYQYDLGAWTGSAVEYVGGNTLMVSRGGIYSGNSYANQEIMYYNIGVNSYVATGSYISQPHDLTYANSWESLDLSMEVPAESSVAVETRSSSDSITWSEWQVLSGDSIQSPAQVRYLQVKITINATPDGSATPVVHGYSVNYQNDDVDPTNPTSVTAMSQEVGGTEVLPSPQSYAHAHPYFNWSDPGDESSASDSGSGVVGYFVYFGPNMAADPVNDGFYSTSSSYSANDAIETGHNYLVVSTKDRAGNISAPSMLFDYLYSGASPASNILRTSSDDFSAGSLTNISTSGDQLKLAGKNGFWREYRLSSTLATTGYGTSMVYKPALGKIYTARGANTNTFYEYDIATDTWTTLNSTGLGTINYGGGLVDGPGNYIYAARGGGLGTFYRYDVANNAAGWSDSDAEDAPTGCFGYGGYLIYDGSRYIYATKGGDDAFYRFDPLTTADGEWAQRTNINFGYPDITSSNNTANGASLAYDGVNTIYAIQGGNLSGFGKYIISGAGANTWQPITDSLPVIAGAGADLTWDSVDQRLIYIPGGNLRAVYEYDPTDGEWTRLASAPSYFSYGTFTVEVGDYMYVLRSAGTSSFYKYNLRKNSWFMPNNDLFGPSWYEAPQTASTYFGTNAGSDMIHGDGSNIYAMRGNYDNMFIKYDSSTGQVTELAPTPTGSYQDGSLVYDEDDGAIYAILGQFDQSFYKYTISSNTWARLDDDPLKAMPSYGASLVYDGSQYIYYFRGANSTTWYRYDKNAIAGSRWSNTLSVTGFGGNGYGSQAVFKDNKIYVMRGQNVNPNVLYSFDTTQVLPGSWQALASVAAPVYYDGFLVDGRDGYLYLSPAGNVATYGKQFWRYDISGNSWGQVADFPGLVGYGGSADYNGSNKIYAFSGAGTDSFSEGIYSYVVQGANSSFEEAGSYTSEAIDLTSMAGKAPYAWGNIEINSTISSNTTLKVETQTSSDGISWSSFSEVNKEKARSSLKQYAINSPLARYIKVKISLESGDGYLSPSVTSFALNYYNDLDSPANPTALTQAKSRPTDGIDIVDSNWYNSNTPYFVWPSVGEANAADDGLGGSGVAGYYINVSQTDAEDNCSGNPSTTSGLLTPNEGNLYYQTANSLTIPSGIISNGNSYCLRLTTKDNAGNVQANPWQSFKYRYETTAPSLPTDISVNPLTYTNVDNYTFTVSDDAEDVGAGLYKYQYQTGADGSTWYDFDPLLGTEVAIPNDDHPQGKYRDGVNVFRFRVMDNAGNISSTATVNYYFGSTAPSPPQGLMVDPEEPATTNSFTFQWELPATYVGDPSKITYHYSVGSEPTEYNTNSTLARAVGPGPFATLKGKNKFYVVAEDEAGNIDWNQFADIEFFADTSAPASPSYVNVSDISDKEAEQFRLVISWMEPEITDIGNFAGYDIYESATEDGEYTKISNTTGTAHVHLNLERDTRHYYKVYSVDKTGNASAPSEVASAVATGRFTKPPNITKEPQTEAKARSCIVTWNTSREANSAVEYGTTNEFGNTVGNRATDYVTDHNVNIGNLQPDTKYYYRVVFTDPDGNIGTSETGEFITAPSPLVSGLKVEDVTLSSMLITWDSNVPSYGEIVYGLTSSFGSKIEEEHYFTRKHTIKLSDLTSDTPYHFQVRAVDEEGNVFNSDEYIQSTLPLPRVSDVQVQNLTNVEKPTMAITYKTNVETTTIVRYTASGKTKEFLTSDYSKEHSLEIDNLLPQTEYSLEITGRDRYGNEAKPEMHSVTTLSDTMPPRIEKITDKRKIIGEGKSAEAQLTVKVTSNEPTTMVIEATRGVSASDFGIKSNISELGLEHSMVLKLGEAGSAYSYRVRLVDAAGNETVSETKTLVLTAGNKTAFDYIVSVFSRSFSWLGSILK